MLKVLRLVLRIGPTSGPFNQLTLPTLDRFETTVCSYFPSPFAGSGLPDARLRYYEGNGRATAFVNRLRRLLRQRHFDVIHVHSPHLGPLLNAASLPGLRWNSRRTVMTLHSSYSVYKKRNRCLLWPSFLTAARLVCCGQASLDSLPSWLRFAGGQRLTSISNGVDVAHVDEARPLPLRDDSAENRPFRLISVGALRGLKNHLTVVRALARISDPNLTLTVVGAGDDRERIQNEVTRLNLAGRVELTGQLSRQETLRRMWQADAFVSVSRGEGLPVALLEAMACECPVILSDIPPHLEIARRCEGASFVGSEDVDTLANRVTSLVQSSAEARDAWGRACRGRVQRKFSLTRMLDEYEHLYRDVASSACLWLRHPAAEAIVKRVAEDGA